MLVYSTFKGVLSLSIVLSPTTIEGMVDNALELECDMTCISTIILLSTANFTSLKYHLNANPQL